MTKITATTATKEAGEGIALLSPSLGRVDADKVDVATARDVVSGLLAGWRNAPNSSVVATVSGLPVAVREELANQREKTARGVYHGDTFYLVADEQEKAQDSYGRPDQQPAGSRFAPIAGLDSFIRQPLRRVNAVSFGD